MYNSIQRFFTRKSTIAPEEASYDYKAAGTVFTDNRHMLAGYQPYKRKPFISGIGGKKEEGETYMQTALRETLDELFEVEAASELILKIKKEIRPKKVVKNGSYVFVVYDFKDLEKLLGILRYHRIKSKLYDTFPKTLMELIMTRKNTESSEISGLALLPLVEHNSSNPFVDPHLISDMPLLLRHTK